MTNAGLDELRHRSRARPARTLCDVETPDALCATVAASQHGCLSLDQARRCGLDREDVHHRVSSGRWRRIMSRTYVLRGAPGTWEQRVHAALLWAGDGAAASGVCAAALWRLPNFPPSRIEVSVSGPRKSRYGVVVRRVRLEPSDVGRVRGIPVTTPARTLADLAGRLDDARFDLALHHCLHDRLTTLDDLEEVSARRSGPGFAGATRLRSALAAYGSGPAAASPLEVRVDRRLRAAGLPRPERQWPVDTGSGRRYLDFAWPGPRVALEVDGYRWHSSRTAWQRDRERLAELRRAGWTVVHVTADDLSRFGPVAQELASLLR